jgi:mannose-6-phosphate isomerase-like protein (cupin superfamily)
VDIYHFSQLQNTGKRYFEFARTPDLSAGVYRLQVGATDKQTPHKEDEIYYVVAGRADFTSGRRTVKVKTGDVLFVGAREDHHFHDIEEDLELLVVFAPAEGSR